MMKKQSIAGAIIFLLAFLIPFNAKKFIYAFSPRVDEYSSVFLYLTDFFLLAVIILFFLFGGSIKYELRALFGKILSVFVILSFLSIFLASEEGVAIYRALRLTLYAGTVVTIPFFIRNGVIRFRLVCGAFASSAILQSVIGFLQFLTGGSVGLRVLGESVITPATTGVARVFVNGEYFLRAYGTMPHANILASFLVLGLLCLFYLLISNKKSETFDFLNWIAPLIGVFIILSGLAVTFSRSGWIVFFVTGLLLLFFGIMKREYRKNTFFVFSMFLAQIVAIGFILGWAIVPRAGFTVGEPSVNHRVLYNKIGMEIISQNPLGVGIGNEVSAGVKMGLYKQEGFLNWRLWQPVHNLYILIASELGIFGLFVFLVAMVSLFFERIKKSDGLSKFSVKNFVHYMNFDFLTAAILAFSILLFGFFDHFMWDIPAGELMLWFSLSLVLASKENYTSALLRKDVGVVIQNV